MNTNSFERAARAAKVAKLAAHITETVAMLGLTPESDGYTIAELVRSLNDKAWNSAAITIGVKPRGNKALVSVETRLATIAHFIDRARKAS